MEGQAWPSGREKGYSETAQPAEEKPAVEAAAPAGDGYAASANSQVFHRAGCKSAAKISEKNLIRYGSREEAVQAGKRPCAECQP